MATTLTLTGVQAITGGELNLNGANADMATITLLPGWRPRVAKRRRSALGGKLVEDVVESIPLRVHGTTELECITALEALAAAMLQAWSWKDGAAVDAVVLNYAIDGTTLTNPLQTAVLGTPDDAADILELPVTFNRYLQVFEASPVVLPLERRGEWLGDEESTVNSSAAENPAVNVASFVSALTTPGPVKFSIRFTSGNGDQDEIGDGFLFIADSAQKIYASSTVGASTTGTSTLDPSHADDDASGNEVAQIVPNDTVSIRVGPELSHTFLSNAGTHIYMFFLVVKNLSNSVTWSIYQINYTTTPGISYDQALPISPVEIAPDNNNPQIITIGPFVFDQAFSGLPSFDIAPDSAPGAGHELEIDTIAIVELGAGVTALSLRGINFSDFDNHVTIDHNLLSELKPSVSAGLVSGTSQDRSIDHNGTPLVFNGTAEFAALVLGTQQNNWILGHDSGGGFSPVQTAVYATRRPAYLVPR